MRTICFQSLFGTKENGANWILLALDDITIRKEIEKVEKKNSDDIKKILENIPQITFTASADGAVIYLTSFF